MIARDLAAVESWSGGEPPTVPPNDLGIALLVVLGLIVIVAVTIFVVVWRDRPATPGSTWKKWGVKRR